MMLLLLQTREEQKKKIPPELATRNLFIFAFNSRVVYCTWTLIALGISRGMWQNDWRFYAADKEAKKPKRWEDDEEDEDFWGD